MLADVAVVQVRNIRISRRDSNLAPFSTLYLSVSDSLRLGPRKISESIICFSLQADIVQLKPLQEIDRGQMQFFGLVHSLFCNIRGLPDQFQPRTNCGPCTLARTALKRQAPANYCVDSRPPIAGAGQLSCAFSFEIIAEIFFSRADL